MLRPPETIKTARLRLRLPTMEDAGALFRKYTQDPEVTRYMIWQPHVQIQDTQEYLRRCIRRWQDGTGFPWIVERTVDNELIGMIELRIDRFRADFGYAVACEYWGNGYATEMAKAVVAWAMSQKEIYRVWATCDTENLASARVLEKAGMQREGILRRYILHPNISAEPRDSYCYSMVK